MLRIQSTPNLEKWAESLRNTVNTELQIEEGIGPDEQFQIIEPSEFAAGYDPEEREEAVNRLWVKMQNHAGSSYWFAEGSPIPDAMYFGPVATWAAEKLDGE